MKWKRSRKAKEHVTATSLTDKERTSVGIEIIRPHDSSFNSILEDEEEMEREEKLEKDNIDMFRDDSLCSVGLTVDAGQGSGTYYSSFSEEMEEVAPGGGDLVFP